MGYSGTCPQDEIAELRRGYLYGCALGRARATHDDARINRLMRAFEHGCDMGSGAEPPPAPNAEELMRQFSSRDP